MLGWFPKVFEDELIYSLCARYANKSLNVSTRYILENCFGDQRYRVTPDFPSNLEGLSKQIRTFNYSDVESLIYNHTPFYYYTNFLHTPNKEIILNEIKNTQKKNIHMLIGQAARNVKESMYFKYCPDCFKKDLETYGESYWRRIHQLPSVFVCLEHNILLHFSSVLYRNKNTELISPNKNNCIPSPLNQCITSKMSKKEFNHLKEIAIVSKLILNNKINVDLTKLSTVYKDFLRMKNLLTSGGHVRQGDLYKEFVTYYGRDILVYFQSMPDLESESCWLKTITRKHRISFHPMRHLLLLNFLGIKIDSLNMENLNNGPFGKGPFPCLNPAAEHFKKLVVQNIEIKRCTDTGESLGIFSCSCGFIYTRLGPDLDQNEMYNYRYIRNFGELWKKKLKEYIDQEQLSFRKTALLLNVDVGTVIKYYKQNIEENKKEDKNCSNIINEYRLIWSNVRDANPECSKTELRKLQPKVYMWLYKNDNEWLVNNSPIKSNKNNSKISRIDWNNRDLKLLGEIKKYLSKTDIVERPIRLTKRHIGIAINKLSSIEKNLDKLPLTKEFISAITESKFEYQKRLKAWQINYPKS